MEWPKILSENGTTPHGSDQTTDSVFCNQQAIFLGRKLVATARKQNNARPVPERQKKKKSQP